MIEVLNERRRYRRHNLRIPVQYRNMKTSSNAYSGALTMDIGEGGIRFVGNEFLSLSNRLLLLIALPAPSHSLKTISKVAWIKKVPMGEQYEIGNQFLSMSDEDKRELKSYINKTAFTKV